MTGIMSIISLVENTTLSHEILVQQGFLLVTFLTAILHLGDTFHRCLHFALDVSVLLVTIFTGGNCLGAVDGEKCMVRFFT
jgi:hypothetical protein